MNLQSKIDEIFFKLKTESDKMSLTVNVVENLTSYLLTLVVNELSAHSTKIAAMNLQLDVTPEALDAANKKLLGLLSAAAPFEVFLAARFPELMPLVTLAQNYSNLAKE